MAAPTPVQAGTGAIWQSGAPVACSLSGATVGNVVILHGIVDGAGGSPTLSSHANLEDIAGTDNALTLIASAGTSPRAQCGDPSGAEQFVYIGRALTSAPAVSVSQGSGLDCYFRLYEFADVNGGTTLADVIENATAGAWTNDSGTSATVADSGVTTLGPDRLACNFVGVNDDNAVASFTGETGGDWTEAFAEFASSTGTDACIQLQTAVMAAAGTINGGTLTMAASDAWGVVGFALIGTTVDRATFANPTNFQDPGLF